eukprot:ctg_1453.g383
MVGIAAAGSACRVIVVEVSHALQHQRPQSPDAPHTPLPGQRAMIDSASQVSGAAGEMDPQPPWSIAPSDTAPISPPLAKDWLDALFMDDRAASCAAPEMPWPPTNSDHEMLAQRRHCHAFDVEALDPVAEAMASAMPPEHRSGTDAAAAVSAMSVNAAPAPGTASSVPTTEWMGVLSDLPELLGATMPPGPLREEAGEDPTSLLAAMLGNDRWGDLTAPTSRARVFGEAASATMAPADGNDAGAGHSCVSTDVAAAALESPRDIHIGNSPSACPSSPDAGMSRTDSLLQTEWLTPERPSKATTHQRREPAPTRSTHMHETGSVGHRSLPSMSSVSTRTPSSTCSSSSSFSPLPSPARPPHHPSSLAGGCDTSPLPPPPKHVCSASPDRVVAHFVEPAVSLRLSDLGTVGCAREQVVERVEALLLEAFALAQAYEQRRRRATGRSTGASPSSASVHVTDATMRAYQQQLSRCLASAPSLRASDNNHLDSTSMPVDSPAESYEAVVRRAAHVCGRKERRTRPPEISFRLVGLGLLLSGVDAASDQQVLQERLQRRFECAVTVNGWDDTTIPLARVMWPWGVPSAVPTVDASREARDAAAAEGGALSAAAVLIASERGSMCRLVAPARLMGNNRHGATDVRIGGYGTLLGDDGSPAVMVLEAIRMALAVRDHLLLDCVACGVGQACSVPHGTPADTSTVDIAQLQHDAEALLRSLAEHTDCADLDALIQGMYRMQGEREWIARLAPAVIQLALTRSDTGRPSPSISSLAAGSGAAVPSGGNGIARRALWRAGFALGRHVAAAIRQWIGDAAAAPSTAQRILPVACVGGLFAYLRNTPLGAGLRCGLQTMPSGRPGWSGEVHLLRLRTPPLSSTAGGATKTVCSGEVVAALQVADALALPPSLLPQLMLLQAHGSRGGDGAGRHTLLPAVAEWMRVACGDREGGCASMT